MGGVVYVYCGGRGNLRENREDPAPTVRIAGRSLGGLPYRPSFTPRRHLRELRRRITTRHAASLRPSGNGRIRFKPPYSKRGNPPKAPYGLNLYRRLPLLAGREVSIMRFDLSKTITTRHAASLRSSQCEDSPAPRHHRRIPSIPSHWPCPAQRLPIHSVASRMWIVSVSVRKAWFLQ